MYTVNLHIENTHAVRGDGRHLNPMRETVVGIQLHMW
jgi:hypothetical protein